MPKTKQRSLPNYIEDMGVQVERKIKPKKKIPSVPRVGQASYPSGTLEALQHYLSTKPDKRSTNMLHDIIYKLAVADVPWPEIGRRVNLPPHECQQIYRELLSKYHAFSPAEMRLHLTAQIQGVINMMHQAAAAGSAEHAKIILAATERLAKMHELEVARSKIEVQVVTDHQATLLIHVVGMILESLLGRAEIREALAPDVIDSVAAEVLELAGSEIQRAQEQMVEV